MGDKDKGLYLKYKIEHMDGTPVDSDGQYFVLKLNSEDLAHREASREAAKCYSAEVRHSMPSLADDLEELLDCINDISAEDEEAIEVAAKEHFRFDESVDIDPNPRISLSDSGDGYCGAWIQGWVFFPISEWPEGLRNKYEEDYDAD